MSGISRLKVEAARLKSVYDQSIDAMKSASQDEAAQAALPVVDSVPQAVDQDLSPPVSVEAGAEDGAATQSDDSDQVNWEQEARKWEHKYKVYQGMQKSELKKAAELATSRLYTQISELQKKVEAYEQKEFEETPFITDDDLDENEREVIGPAALKIMDKMVKKASGRMRPSAPLIETVATPDSALNELKAQVEKARDDLIRTELKSQGIDAVALRQHPAFEEWTVKNEFGVSNGEILSNLTNLARAGDDESIDNLVLTLKRFAAQVKGVRPPAAFPSVSQPLASKSPKIVGASEYAKAAIDYSRGRISRADFAIIETRMKVAQKEGRLDYNK